MINQAETNVASDHDDDDEEEEEEGKLTLSCHEHIDTDDHA